MYFPVFFNLIIIIILQLLLTDKLIIGGDFNVRTAILPDCVNEDAKDLKYQIPIFIRYLCNKLTFFEGLFQILQKEEANICSTLLCNCKI